MRPPLRECVEQLVPDCQRARRTWREHFVCGPCTREIIRLSKQTESFRDFRRRLNAQ